MPRFWGSVKWKPGLRNLIEIAIISLCLANLAFIALLFPKGMGFGDPDEGLFMLALDAQNVDTMVSTAFITIPRLIFWMPPDILRYRYLRFMVGLGLGVVVSVAFWQWLRTTFPARRLEPLEFAAGVGLVFVGTTFFPMGIQIIPFGYNDFINWGALLTGAGLLFAANRANPMRVGVISFLVGFVTGWNFFNKPPAAGCIGGVYLLGLWLPCLWNWRRNLIVGGAFLGGGGLAVSIFFGWVLSPAQWINVITFGSLRESGFAQLFGMLVLRYVQEILTLSVMLLPEYVVVLAVICWLRRNRFSVRRLVKASIGGLIGALFVLTVLVLKWADIIAFVKMYPFLKRGLYWLPVPHLQLLLLLAVALTLTAYQAARGVPLAKYMVRSFRARPEPLVMLGALCVLPFAAGISSNQPLALITCQNIWAWILVLLFIAAWIRPYIPHAVRWGILGLLPCCLLLIEQAAIIRLVYGSFREIAGYCCAVAELPKGQGLLFPTTEAAYYRAVYRILREKSDYTPGDGLVGLYRQTNLVYLLGGRIPGTNTLSYQSPEWFAKEATVKFLNRVVGAEIANAFLLLDQAIAPDLLKLMRAKGALFPENYVRLGDVAEVSSGHPTGNRLQIYAPKARAR